MSEGYTQHIKKIHKKKNNSLPYLKKIKQRNKKEESTITQHKQRSLNKRPRNYKEHEKLKELVP